MFLPDKSDAIHKAWLYRILTRIADDNFLVQNLRFKGGTCAAMRGLLDRFSVDLDFDLLNFKENQKKVEKLLENIFDDLGLIIKDKSSQVPQYFLKYPAAASKRSILKVEVVFPAPASNAYEPVRLTDIDRILFCHNIETMVANKLAAILDRYEKHESIAGRDIYDIHYFFLHGYKYKPEILLERQNITLKEFFIKLIAFIEKHVTENIIAQDLNYLLPVEKFRKIRKIIKQELLILLKDELQRLEN